MSTVLVVEDEEQVRVLAEAIIQEAGHQTLTASDLPEALAVITGDGAVDLLFTDIQLKDAEHGGIEVAQEALKHRPGLKVLYTTGGNVTDGTRALFVDGAAVLQKPYLPADLTDAVNKRLAAK
ncbi:MAG: response regulator [Methylobacteriaceae bacterium]|nr:response regulator [Methylobacteriaceae bacterium]